MTPLQRYAALTDQHFAARDVVRDLDHTWGYAAYGAVAKRLGVTVADVDRLLADLAAVGLVAISRGQNAAFYEPVLPVLGSVA